MEAVIFCQDMGVKEFILEGDALQVVTNFSKDKKNWSQGGPLINDAKHLLNSFARWSINHRKRDANKAAHVVAQDALKLQEDLYDLEDIPNCIYPIVISYMLQVFFEQ